MEDLPAPGKAGEAEAPPRRNCWEVMACGCEPGGARARELGVCPAAVETRVDGIHGGRNGGRVCWAVAGTLCGGTVQGTYAKKMNECLFCPFYRMVCRQEGEDLVPSVVILMRLAAVPG